MQTGKIFYLQTATSCDKIETTITHELLDGFWLYKLKYSWSEIGRTNLIVHRDITSYNPTSLDNTLMLSPRLNG